MPRKSLKLIVLTGSDRPEVRQAWQTLLPYLKQTDGIEVVGEYPRSKDIEDNIDADIVVVLGGDGSILRGCRQLGRRQIPIVGINLGRLGFLADLTLEEFQQLLPQLQRSEFEVGEYLMFECTHRLADGTSHVDLGLNEVTVTSSTALRMVDISLDIDDQPVTTFSCDGLIISTPVGSTAHNLSAGGPILRQDLQAFCITPICPHTLTVRRADATFKKVHFPGHCYYSTLHRKLGWRGQLDYRERIGQSTDTEDN
jgi:NAD+ kinase